MAYARSIPATDSEGGFHNLDTAGKQTVEELMSSVLPPNKLRGAALLTPSGSIFQGGDTAQSLLDDLPRGEVARITRALPAG